MSQLEQIAKEIEKKYKEKGKKYLKPLILIPILLSFVIAFFIPQGVLISYPTDVIDPLLIYLINGYFFSVTLTILGCIIIVLISTGQVAKPRLQKPIEDTKSIFEFIISSPKKEEILQILLMLNDIIKKNAIQNYLTLAEIFTSIYKRIGRVEKRLDKQDTQIQEIKFGYMREFQLQRLKYEQSERRRKSVEGYLEIEKQENLKLNQENQKLKTVNDEKIQIIEDKTQSKNNSENSSVNKDNQFEEDL